MEDKAAFNSVDGPFPLWHEPLTDLWIKTIRMNNGDTTIYDEIDYDGDPLKWPAGTYIVQARPDLDEQPMTI